jgi:hypothetical protein
LCVIGFFGATYLFSYFFSVPQGCGCRATNMPNALSEAFILENTIGDATSITIRTGQIGDVGGLQICYPQRPRRGNITEISGLADRECQYENNYELGQTSHRKTDIEASIVYEITERFSQFDSKRTAGSNIKRDANGILYINRSTGTCTFGLPEWGEAKLSGRLECVDPVFYPNPWSWFPQTVELFYTRAFYAIHKKPAAAN